MTNQIIKSNLYLTTAEPLKQFLTGQLSPHTKRAYQTDVKLFLEYCNVTEKKLIKLNSGEVYQNVIGYRNSISKIKDGTDYIINATTVTRKLSSLKRYFEFLVKLGFYKSNPIEDIKSPSVPIESTSESLTVSEIKAVFKQVNKNIIIGIRDLAVLSLLFHCALRRSEIAKLIINDIKRDGEFTVIQFISKRNKTRQIPLKPEVLKAIKDYLHSTSRNLNSGGFIFLRHSNNYKNVKLDQPLSPEAIYNLVKKYVKQINIDKTISPHSFRHSSVTIALDNGSTYRDVMNLTGHSDSRLVKRYDRGDKLKNNATWKLPSIN